MHYSHDSSSIGLLSFRHLTLARGVLYIALVLGVMLVASMSAHGATIRVKPTGNDSNSGADWSHAKATVTAAIQAAQANDEIWIAAGVYKERIANRKAGSVSVDIAIYGGFAGTETSREQRNIAANASILDGEFLGTVVTIDWQASRSMRIDGLRIRNGKSGQGGGISVLSSAPTIVNNDLLGNQADFGGGLMVWGYRSLPSAAQALIESNVIQVNHADDGGGGAALVGSSAELRNNTIVGNTTYGRGGGIGVWISESALVARPVIVNNFIYENAANVAASAEFVGGGGIFATERNLADEPLGGICAPRILSNIIAANAAVASGGGIAFINSENEAAQIINNTIVGNSGSGVYWGNAFPTIVNNIVAKNTWGLEEDIGNPYVETIRFNNLGGNEVHARITNYFQLSDLTGIDGNISVNPQMVLFGSGRQRIQPASPCRDAGDDAAVDPAWTDIDRESRVQGAHVDIGADESSGVSWADIPTVVHVRPTGDDGLDGLSWATAKRTVQNGVHAAWAAGGGEVWVAEGTYAEHLVLYAWVHLYGGFVGNETLRSQRDPTTHVSVIDGSEVPPVVNCGHAGYRVATIDGFRIMRGGRYMGGAISSPNMPTGLGGGIRCDTSSPVISNNAIVYNSLGDWSTPPLIPPQGGGIGLLGSHPLIWGNTIAENETLHFSGEGGGIYCELSLADIYYNTIYSNHSNNGSAVRCTLARPMLYNNRIEANQHYYLPPVYIGPGESAVSLPACFDFELDYNYFVSNTGETGGAVCVSQSDRGTITNNLFVGNRAYQAQLGTGGEGGAIWLLARRNPPGSISINGNTFASNTATNFFMGEQGGAIAVIPDSDQVVISNNVMAFNSSGIYKRSAMPLNPTLINNQLWNWTGGLNKNYVNVPIGPTDLQSDPQFVDRVNGNYRLSATSPAIEAGSDPHTVMPYDLDGAPRIQDGHGTGIAHVDIGAYEFSPDFDADGTPDWSDADDDNDGAADVADCAPRNATVWNAPVDVTPMTITKAPAITLGWSVQDPGTRYDIVDGVVTMLRSDHDFTRATCRAQNISNPSWADSAPGPSASEARYYLVRAKNVCGTGTWGHGSNAQPRVVTVCP